MTRSSHNHLAVFTLCIISLTSYIVSESIGEDENYHVEENKNVLCDFQHGNVSPFSETRGTLLLNPTMISNSTCAWLLSKSPLLLYFNVVELDRNDIIVFKSLSSSTEKIFSYLLPGIVAIGGGDWKLEVRFSHSKKKRHLSIGYSKDLNFNLDLSNVSSLIIYEIIDEMDKNLKFNLNVTKNTERHGTLLQVVPKEASNSLSTSPGVTKFDKAGYIFAAQTAAMMLTIKPQLYQRIMLEVHNVVSRCSSEVIDPVETKWARDENYYYNSYYDGLKPTIKCAKLLSLSDPEGSIRVNFRSHSRRNFDSDAKLTFAGSTLSLVINKKVAPAYADQTLTFNGSELVVLYEGPDADSYVFDNQLTFEGILALDNQPSGILKKSKTESLRFISYSYSGKTYPSIVLGSPLNSGVTMKICENNCSSRPLVVFRGSEALPPIISLKSNRTLAVEITADTVNKLTELPDYKFKALNSSCNKLSIGQSDFLSIKDMTLNECIWTIIPSEMISASQLILSFNFLESFNENDCVEVFSMEHYSDILIANSCGKRNLPAPATLLLDKAKRYYVRVSKDERTSKLWFEASYSPVVF